MSDLVAIIQKDVLKILPRVDFQELHGKTILVTGASGLVGTYFLAILRELRAKKMSCKVVAVVQNKFPEYLSYFGEDVKFIRCDLTDAKCLSSLPQADYIIHAAGYGQPGKFMEDPIKTIELNTTCTIALCEKLKKGGKFLFLSTSELYSGLPNPPYREDQVGTTNTTHPRSCYIEAKRCGEAIVNAYRGQGLNAKSARLSLAYGPATKPNDQRAINSFIQKALAGKLELLDEGLARRTYCYVEDAVEILWNILLFGKEPIYNVGGISSVTIAELAGTIGKFLNVAVIFPKVPKQDRAAPEDVRLDMTKVKDEFNKTEYISLDRGLARTIEWQKLLYNLPKA